ncbi:MAG: META domain-containing protein [Rubellimicrobium sp.]|nr:META domain-containing protein [Rubellimicrobium sp.]
MSKYSCHILAAALAAGLTGSAAQAGDETLAGAAAMPEPTPPVVARGNEPFWFLTLAEGRMVFAPLDGEVIDLPLPTPVETAEGWRFAAEAGLSATLSGGPCRDTMTGMPHPFAASVDVGGQVLAGCAGDPADLLAGSEWQVTMIGADPVPADAEVTMLFEAEGRVSGSSGCNRFFGGFALTGEGLGFDPNMAGTMMACEDATMELERAFLESLPLVTGFDIGTDGGLLLLSGDRAVIHAAR